MKRKMRPVLLALLAVVLAFALVLAGCSASDSAYVTSIEKTGSDGLQDIYTITYSDGTTDTYTVTNGSDGEDITITDIWQAYMEETGTEISFSEFLSQYLTVSDETTALSVQESLLSSMKVYTEFVVTETTQSMYPPHYTSETDIEVLQGSAVIWSMDTAEDGYTYIVTNYHVVYNNEADTEKNGGTDLARKITGYLYGSEGAPAASGTDENGYTAYTYGDYAIGLEYVGGSVLSDIAVLRADTADILAINEQAQAVTLADDYYVGQTVYAVGNAEGMGLSAVQGIISTEDELITLSIDGTTRTYRSLRIDASTHEGNSGGGLFNSSGELVGITNAGYTATDGMNYAIPLEIAEGTVENILYYANDGDESTNGAYRITLGVTVRTENARNVYDADKGYGKVQEDVYLYTVEEGSLADSLGLNAGDKLVSIIVNGEEHAITRQYDISDLILTIRPNSTVQIRYERGGSETTTSEITVVFGTHFSQMA